jgi:hypothetical protein
MNEYDEAFHRTVLEAIERAKERSREVQAQAAEAKVKSDHIRAEALRTRMAHDRSPRSP